MRTIHYAISSVFLSLLSTSCKVSDLQYPDPQEMPTAYTYNTTSAVKRDSINIGEMPWRSFFTDPLLQNMIERALLQNTDLQFALKNIEIAQWKLKQVKSSFFPKAQVSLNTSTSNPSNNSLNAMSLTNTLGQNYIEDYTATMSISWEADIWGKIKNQNKAGLALYLQTQEAKKAIQIHLIDQVAKGYYQLLALYQVKDVVETNLKLSEKTYVFAQYQYEIGDINLFALEQLDAQRLAAAALIPDLEKQIVLQENILQVLSGEFPTNIALNKTVEPITVPTVLAVGMPASLLRNRPDVKQAELNVITLDAYRKVARAEMYPSLSISLQSGVNAFKSSDWFTVPASLFGIVAGNLTAPIFQNKALKTKYEVARLEHEKSVFAFRQQVIQAVTEVTDALVSIQKLQEQTAMVNEQTAKLNSAVKQVDLLFTYGEVSYLNVIVAQSNKLHADLEVIQLNKARLIAFVDLYRALGGGKD